MGPARLPPGSLPLPVSPRWRDSPAPHHLQHLAHPWQKPGGVERMGKGEESTDTGRGKGRDADNSRKGGGLCRPWFAAPRFGVKEKVKAFHITVDVQLKQDPKREGKAEGTDFPELS